MAKLRNQNQYTDTLAGDDQFQQLRQASNEEPKGFGKIFQRGADGKIDLKNLQINQNIQGMNNRMKELGVDLPKDYAYSPRTGEITQDSWMDRHGLKLALGAMGGIAGGAFLPALLGAGGAAGGASSAATPALSSLPVTAATPTAGILGTAGSIAGGGAATGGAMAGIGKFMNSPLGLSLLGMGTGLLGDLLGGDEETDNLKSFADVDDDDPRKALVDPVQNMYNAIRSTNLLAQAFGQKAAGPAGLRKPQMPGFGGRGPAMDIGSPDRPQGMDLSAFLADLQAQLPAERPPLPGGAAASGESPFFQGTRRRLAGK